MNRAIVYIASGQQYIDEAIKSAESAKRWGDYHYIMCSPDLSFNENREENGFDSVASLPKRQFDYWYLDMVYYLHKFLTTWRFCGFDQFLLLDTDTYVCGCLSDFFTILDRFDIAGTQAIGRETMIQRKDIPASFPELHVGALSFKRNERVEKLFELWLKLYQDNPELYGNNDQGPLREALWLSPDIQLGILPAEFCFRYRWGGLVNGQVRVLHGRENSTPYEQVATQVNKSTKIRVFKKRELA